MRIKPLLLGYVFASGMLFSQMASAVVGSNPLFQNPLWWFGTPNPNPPEQIVTYEFAPLANLPNYTQQNFGWLEGFDFEACVGGLGVVSSAQQVGPYGTSTVASVTRGCS